MSDDGDTVRYALAHGYGVHNTIAEKDRVLAALARLETAARDHEDQEWNLIVAQRDALAEALRRIAATAAVPDLDANRGMLALRDEYAAQARAALAETGLEQPNPDWARRFDP